MGKLFHEYGGLIIGVIVVVLIVVVGLLIGNQFKTASSTQFTNLENVVNEQMVDIQGDNTQ